MVVTRACILAARDIRPMLHQSQLSVRRLKICVASMPAFSTVYRASVLSSRRNNRRSTGHGPDISGTSLSLHRGRRYRAASVPALASDVATADAEAPAGAQQAENIVDVLRSRGLVQEVTSDDLHTTSATEALSVYVGFDPTADSIHIGNLLAVIVLGWFQRCGHHPVALLGGATGRVGDPSGKSAERPVLSEKEINRNVEGIASVLRSILSRNFPAGEIKVVNNLDWIGSMSLLTFLRDVGKLARMGTMLAKDSVRSRLEAESGMSYTEFTYQLLQGYDFVHLCKNDGVRVQIGGSDQWGNITAGTDLIRRILGDDAPQCFGLTFPLLVDSDGKKFGKSESGAVWLSEDKLSPYKFYQYLFKTTDADVIRFLKMLTFLPLERIAEIEASMSEPGYQPNSAQRLLAEEVTRFVHGDKGVEAALKATQALKPGSETRLDAESLLEIAADVPTVSLQKEAVLRSVVDILVATKLQQSKAAARRLIKGGGVYVNNAKIGDEAATLSESDLIEGRLLLLAAGKKNKMLVRIEQ